jgi:hypothetical protein
VRTLRVSTLGLRTVSPVACNSRAGPLRERQGPEPVEHLVGGPQVLAGVHAPLPATQPLAVEQVGPAQLHPYARSVEPLDRLALRRLGGAAIGDEGRRKSQGKRSKYGIR